MWNYRVIKFKDHVGLYETIYNDENELSAHSEQPEIVGETVQDLRDTLDMMSSDLQKHENDSQQILDGGNIKFHPLGENQMKLDLDIPYEFD